MIIIIIVKCIYDCVCNNKLIYTKQAYLKTTLNGILKPLPNTIGCYFISKTYKKKLISFLTSILQIRHLINVEQNLKEVCMV